MTQRFWMAGLKFFQWLTMRLAESLSHYERLLKQSDAIADNILCLVQSVVRHVVSTRHDLFAAYAPCPCGSGMNLKFCCGRSTN